jgi:hypothetical protein
MAFAAMALFSGLGSQTVTQADESDGPAIMLAQQPVTAKGFSDELPSPSSTQALDRAEQKWLTEDRRPIGEMNLDITPDKGEMPDDIGGKSSDGQYVHFEGARPGTPPLRYTYGWPASSLCHNPLYFEEKGSERYGRSFGVAQPFVSAGHFLGNIALLPLKMTIHPPRSCECKGSTEFHSRSTFLREHPVLRLGSGVAQSAAATGLLVAP